MNLMKCVYPVRHLPNSFQAISVPFRAASNISVHFRSVIGVFFVASFLVLIPWANASLSTLTFQPTPVDMNDLDHHLVYTWRIDNVDLNGLAITNATLSFTNISNWDSNPNVLHLHLLDTAISPGVASFVDDPTGGVPVTDLTDDFISSRYHGSTGWLVKSGTGDTFLADKSFTTTPVDYSLNFSPAQLQSLASYIANGKDLALGIDPDCHFFNDGIKLTMTLSAVPEAVAIYPLIGLISAVVSTEILRRRRAAQLQARKAIET